MTGSIVDRLESLADHGAASMEQAQEIASDALLEIRRLQGIEIIDRKSTRVGAVTVTTTFGRIKPRASRSQPR